MRIHPTTICLLLAAASPLSLSAYENPTTVPMIFNIPQIYGSTEVGYYDLPTSYDLAPSFKEYTAPGPILTFKINTPESSNMPNSFRMQIWWVDPEPEAPAETDNNHVVDADDERFVGQTLDLTDPSAVTHTLINALGFGEDLSSTLQDTLFWRVSLPILSNNTLDYDNPMTVEAGVYKLEDGDGSHIVFGNTSWGSPSYRYVDYTAGTVAIYSTVNSYSLVFSLIDNTDNISKGTIATIGKVYDDDLDVLKAIGGYSSPYDTTNIWELSGSYPYMPLWNSYTQEDYDRYNQPDRSDFITITDISISDLTGTDPSHGLKFIEDQPYTVKADKEEEEDTVVDPNATIKKSFDVSIDEAGVLTFALRDDVTLSSKLVGYYPFYFRVYVDDGVNNGIDGDYYRQSVFIYLYRPFSIYLGDASFDTTVNYPITDDDETTDDIDNFYNWYTSNTFGCYMEQDFPNIRWVYGYEHGWIYMPGESTTKEDGVFWYMAPSTYDDGDDSTAYVNDEVGWVWTRADYYPYLYSYKDGGWLLFLSDFATDSYDKDGDKHNLLSERVFWSYRQKKYITPDLVGDGLE